MNVKETVRTLSPQTSLPLDYQGCSLLLVSHGDTLSILYAAVKGIDLRENRRYGLDTGQLLVLHSLPKPTEDLNP